MNVWTRSEETRLYYYNKNCEIDFCVPSEKIAIQVAYNLSDAVTYEREIGGLRKFLKAFPEYQGYVITRDEENELTIGDKTIQVLPAWKWLLRLPDTRRLNPIKVN